MEGSDLNYYFNWIKTQLSSQVKSYFCLNFTVVSDFFFQEYQCIHVKIRGIFLVLFFFKMKFYFVIFKAKCSLFKQLVFTLVF